MSTLVLGEPKIFINGKEVELDGPVVITTEDLCSCGAESEYGGHGLRDGKMYSEYYCAKCYYKKKREHE